VIQFAAVTRTPMYYLNPGGANQSADGAAQQRESLVFKVEDRIARVSPQWAQVMALIFTAMGQTDRADLSKLQTLWASPQRLSLAEKADATAKVGDAIPWRSLMRYVWDFDPQTIERMESEREEEALATAQRAALLQPDQTQAEPPVDTLPSLDNLVGDNTDITAGEVPTGLGG
jgi:hypothetical protein